MTTRGRPGVQMPGRVRIRAGRVGELGWAFGRQAELYHDEFGYDRLFETHVARGLAPFLEGFDARRDGLWVAVDGSRRLGCIAVQHDPERGGWCKLRWFFVEREGRSRGTGSRLMAHAIRFARRAGYEGILLWTVSDLEAARRLYERAGFQLAHQDEAPCPWAPWAHEQRWELRLPASRQDLPQARTTRRPRRTTRA